MKRNWLIYLLIGLSGLAISCYKDKGNYTYKVPPSPVVANLDTVYSAVIGDTLTVSPQVTIAEPSPKLGFVWEVYVPEKDTAVYYYGPRLQFVFGLGANRHPCKLTIIDSTNGLNYFYPFFIDGVTEYSTGMTVLSLQNGVSTLSFVKPDGSVQPGVYSAINGMDLPTGPMQVIPMADQYIAPIATTSYWVICSGGSNPGVQVDANTFQTIKTLKDNFFSPPATVVPGTFAVNVQGTLQGVANGQLYVGTSQTYNLSPVYGMFGLPATGNYALYHQALFNGTFPYFLGYDSVRRQVVGFTNFGSAAYIGTSYLLTDSIAFDPMNMGLDLVDFEQINDQNCYAFGVGAGDTLFEEKFGAAFIGQIQLSPVYKRPFIRPDLITASTKWTSSPTEIFYFSSGSAVYSYNPLNQQVTPLTTNFGGKAVTMVKITDSGNTLIVGVDGTVFFLNVSTGQNGSLIKRIDGVPGSPVDVTVRTQ
jgi:hypothetical protein